jgi:hypothetical protein
MTKPPVLSYKERCVRRIDGKCIEEKICAGNSTPEMLSVVAREICKGRFYVKASKCY